MKWISVKEKLPDYDIQVLVYQKFCDGCFEEKDHVHRLNIPEDVITIAKYIEADPVLVAYKQAKGDHSWDSYGIDYWSEPHVIAWMPFPPKPPIKLVDEK